MKVFWLKSDTVLPRETWGSSLVIGNLDGVHKGHLFLIEKAKEIALENNIPFNILTFYPHPSLLFYPKMDSFALTPLHSKLRIFKDLGVDNVFLCKFTHRVAGLSAADYIKIFFKRIIKPTYIIVGDDHSFGKNREGNIDILREEGFRVEVIPRDIRYSSSYIRELIADGEMKQVREVMGRYYEVEDFVHHGEKMARKLGFPTANLYIKKYIKPRCGVYATKTFIDGEWKKSFSYYGKRPTLGEIEPVLENHIFDGQYNLYNKRIRIMFIDYIREEKRFNNIEDIKTQLHLDMMKAEDIL